MKSIIIFLHAKYLLLFDNQVNVSELICKDLSIIINLYQFFTQVRPKNANLAADEYGIVFEALNFGCNIVKVILI